MSDVIPVPSDVRETLIATPTQMEGVRGRSVAVLQGGTSAEREVSLVSGPAVAQALRELGDASGLAGVREIEIDKSGRWCLEGGPVEPHVALARIPADTLFFLGLHGGAGEDGTLQGFLDVAGRAYTGSGLAASALCMDKGAARVLCGDAGLRVAAGIHFSRARWLAEREHVLADAWSRVGGEAVAKPTCGGSSLQTMQVHSESELGKALDAIFECCDDALVEAWTHGLEATVGIVGNSGGALRALPVVEIRPRPGRFFDFAEKYGSDGAIETCPPRDLEPEVIAKLSSDALCAYRTLGCDGYARADFIVPRDGGAPVLLELNTLPGFTPRSLLPQAAAVAGISFGALCLELCALALVGHET
ncbi:MAG: D-alanine-D-alanine ligase [Chlamydiales bacterium]